MISGIRFKGLLTVPLAPAESRLIPRGTMTRKDVVDLARNAYYSRESGRNVPINVLFANIDTQDSVSFKNNQRQPYQGPAHIAVVDIGEGTQFDDVDRLFLDMANLGHGNVQITHRPYQKHFTQE